MRGKPKQCQGTPGGNKEYLDGALRIKGAWHQSENQPLDAVIHVSEEKRQPGATWEAGYLVTRRTVNSAAEMMHKKCTEELPGWVERR